MRSGPFLTTFHLICAQMLFRPSLSGLFPSSGWKVDKSSTQTITTLWIYTRHQRTYCFTFKLSAWAPRSPNKSTFSTILANVLLHSTDRTTQAVVNDVFTRWFVWFVCRRTCGDNRSTNRAKSDQAMWIEKGNLAGQRNAFSASVHVCVKGIVRMFWSDGLKWSYEWQIFFLLIALWNPFG